MPIDDEQRLAALVGTETFRRGAAYAKEHAVLETTVLDGERKLYGEVQGNAAQPYTVMVQLTRGEAGRLASFRGSCTCPVHLDCKHAVAVLVNFWRTAPDHIRSPGSSRDVAAPRPLWQTALRDLVSDTASTPDLPTLGLQVELSDRTRSPRTGLAATPHVLLRPVLAGARGGWNRGGVSWPQLGYASVSTNRYPRRMQVLREIGAMDPSVAMTYASNPPIHFDELSSPRIWDLLDAAREVGVPLLHSDRAGTPVPVLADEVEVEVTVDRDGTDLLLLPRLTVAGETLVLNRLLLVGERPHGVVWWGPLGSDPKTGGGLRMARLAEVADPVLRTLADRRLRIPVADEPAFFAEYFPSLRQRISVVAATDAVELPVPSPPELVADVTFGEDDRLTLGWHWRYAIGEAVRREPLWPTSRSTGRDVELEAFAVKAVEAFVADWPRLWELTLDGRRLAPGAALTGIDTARFVTDALPALSATPELTVEVSGEPRSYREAESAPVLSIAGEATPGDRDWFDLAVTVTVDGNDVPFDLLFRALALRESHLVLPDGTWFSLDRPEFAALASLIEEARALNDSGPATVRLSRYQASLWDELERLGVVSGQAAQWQAAARALAAVESVTAPPIPDSLRAELRPYQADGFAWLAFLYEHRLGGILADEMGLGKTLQAIALIAHARVALGVTEPFLVVAPTSVVYNWYAECQRFAPDLDVRMVTETQRRRGVPLATVADGAAVVVTSYALFRLEYDEYASLPWAGLVLDEAQFVKNSTSRGFACAKQLPAPFKLAITGTPMENNLMELWALLSITAPGLFPTPRRFEEYYRRPIERDSDHDRLAQLRARVRPLMLRRTKEQVVTDLPEKQEQVVELPLNPKHRRVYQTHLQRERQKVLGLLGDLDHNRFEIFRSLTLLRQAALDVSLVDTAHGDVPSTKLDALMELLSEITSEGHRTLVFSQFTRFLALARARLEAAGIGYEYLDGRTRRRASVVEAFRSGSAPVFLISLKAGGFGLNLTEADYCILLDPWWNPATEAQAVDRIHRIGQTRNVMVYRLVAKDTIEEKVVALSARKAALFGSVMAADGAAPTSLTAADIRAILD